MAELNTEEFMRMQREAKQRVVEMKNRSRAFAEQMNQSIRTASDPPDLQKQPRTTDTQTKPPIQHTAKEEKESENQKRRDAANKAEVNSNEDLLLLCLFAVLKEETGDPLLPLLLLTLL